MRTSTLTRYYAEPSLRDRNLYEVGRNSITTFKAIPSQDIRGMPLDADCIQTFLCLPYHCCPSCEVVRSLSMFSRLYAGPATDAQGDNTDNTVTDDELIGQAMLIIFAGFDTTSTTLQFCLYFLAKHPDVQEKLFEEVTRVVKSEVPTYEDLSYLKYMEQVINETLRLYPPVPVLSRKAFETRTYGNITIPKGAAVAIPLDLIMRDPKHYEDPEKFDPDRFTEENKAKRDPMAFVPFGYGPRLCIGMRLALLELKVGLVNLIRKVKFELDEKMKNEKLKTGFHGFIVLEKPIILTPRIRE